MYKADGYNVIMPRGDSATIPFVLTKTEEGIETPFILSEGQYVKFEFKMHRNAEAALVQIVTAEQQQEDGTCYLSIEPETSDKLKNGTYQYFMSIHNADDSVVDTWLGFPDIATFTVE